MLNIKSKAFKFLIGTLAVVAFSYASAAMDFGTTTLRVGSKGEAVKAVQTCVGATADGSFGPMTKAKVMAWQATMGLTADGVFGAKSKAAAANGCTATTTTTVSLCPNGMTLASNCTMAPGSTTTTTTSGTEGLLSSVTKLSSYNNTKVTEAQLDVKVLGIEVTAKDADQTIDSLKIALNNSNGSSSKKISKYATELSVWLDGVQLARKSVTAFSDDASDIYTYRFTGMKGVVKQNMKGQLVVAISGAGSIDSTDATNEAWTIFVGSAVGGTDDDYITAVSPNGRYDDYGTATVTSSIDFQKAGGVSSDQKYKVTTSATNPTAATMQVSRTSDTSGKTLLAFDVKAENGAMLVQKIPVDFTSTIGLADGVTPNVEALVKTAYLFANGSQIASESITSGAGVITLTFGNTSKLQYAIAQDATVKFEVKVDLNDVENTGAIASDFDEGDQIKADYTSTNVTNSQIELNNPNQDTVSNRSGTASGEQQTLRSTGMQVTMGAVTSTATESTGGLVISRTYTVPVKVKAFDDTMYIGKTVENTASALATSLTSNIASALGVTVEDSNGATVATGTVGAGTFGAPWSATWTSSDAAQASVTCTGAGAPVASCTGAGAIESFRVDSGSEKNFNLVVVISDIAAGTANSQFRLQLNRVQGFTSSSQLAGEVVAQTLTPSNAYETGFYTVAAN